MSERGLAIAFAVSAAAAAAEAKAAAEWDTAQAKRIADAKTLARKLADEAAEAVDAQAQLCDEANAALKQAMLKLDELEQAKQQAHVGLPMIESGTALRWNKQKGFGFISLRGGEGDIFCHCNDILDGGQLLEGSTVRFVREYDERKQRFRAADVTGGIPTEDTAVASADGHRAANDDRPAHAANDGGHDSGLGPGKSTSRDQKRQRQ